MNLFYSLRTYFCLWHEKSRATIPILYASGMLPPLKLRGRRTLDLSAFPPSPFSFLSAAGGFIFWDLQFVLTLEFWLFVFVSDFEFRISDFNIPPLRRLNAANYYLVFDADNSFPPEARPRPPRLASARPGPLAEM
jgi:hypothetical protein